MVEEDVEGGGSIVVEDVEEGEISDESQSVEEISEEDFIKQDSKKEKEKENSASSSSTNSRVWMSDLYKYSSNYGCSGLHNFAWAQAVQNKPFNETLVREFENARENNEQLNKGSNNSLMMTSSMMVTKEKEKEVVCNVIINDDDSEEIDSNKVEEEQEEEEDGELEEGEIELDSVMTENCNDNIDNSESDSLHQIDEFERISNDEEFEKNIILILESLDTVTVSDAEKSFDGVCYQLWTSLDSLKLIVLERGVSAVGAIVDQCFAGIQAVISVLNTMDLKQQEKHKDTLTRLLAHVKGKVSELFSPEQMKEIQAATNFVDVPFASSNVKDMELDEVQQVTTGEKHDSGILGEKPVAVDLGILGEKPGLLLNSSEKGILRPISVNVGCQNIAIMGPEIFKQGIMSSSSRSRGSFGPLLDLHRDHDIDSLPSPTREVPPPLYLWESQVIGDRNIKSESIPKVANKSEKSPVHAYETDALKAVSSYQQKFGRTSYFTSTRLPSPTPSEDDDDGDGDTNGEVCSSSTVSNVSCVNSPMPLQVDRSIACQMDKLSEQGPVPSRTMGLMSSSPSPQTRALSKSRDPRLRIANPGVGTSDLNAHPLSRDTPKPDIAEEVTNSRKNKYVGETLVDGQDMKKQKNGMANWEVSRDVQVSRGVGRLENCSSSTTPVIGRIHPAESMRIDPRKSENGGCSDQKQATSTSTFNAISGGTEQSPVIGNSSAASLPSLLKDISVNPTMLMQLIMEQQKLAAGAQKASNVTSNLKPVTAPLVNFASSKSYDIEQKSVENPQNPQAASMNPQDQWGKIRMKPRDPRRVLQTNTFQKNDSCRSEEQFKTNGPTTSISSASKDNLSVRQQSEQAQATSLLSQSSPPPDITRQFTKNLKNLADILSSQSTDSDTTASQSASFSQSIPVKAEKTIDGVSTTESKDQQSGTALVMEGVTETSRSQNTWGDVEHLFEGYDDQQKAAIQRERTRRIEEQNKMFAAKKLCLVLDLDHTLLNSAKFNEVDPVHEEILRKKEEQDREKPRRHLFRFSHMGMWTKLRPGIWTFLEKACKLYELHLYTMGNKLYATEMAKVLDPTGVLFSGRVISKGDDGEPFDGDEKLPKSKDLDGVLGMESAVVIIDDSVKVWPHNKLNLILVERYTYFPVSRRQFGLPGPSLLEIDHDERPEDGTLASSLAVIGRIHQNFFSNPSLHEVDVRNILASEQRKILAGCRILFSRIFPVGEAKPHQHPLWQTAEQFGAVCTTQIDNLVTHVVANSPGTDKVNWALSTGRFVVHPGWVEASALLYRRANEHDFAIKTNVP
ncbi:Rna polymerase ii c-terminal domain phosphatase-like [Thalictrum thalictroides]|uniref:protein-serine/threonine phosphatase n=1 Tax=Thalictrum thalictroides TaxID=46969 RepID=A0A7J6WDT1_THATH|nr:Rna polymerase ii c-terminal domain phosphatase-like [Thalictrum thalictroides]